ncbi:MAG: type II toxin-antitoxin system prevent-host-death family antitoxin [Dehalococcoidia bacterium]
MQRTIDLHDLPEQLNAVLRAVTVERTPYVIDQDGRPTAAIVPYDAFVRLSAPDAAENEQAVESVVEDVLAELDAVRAYIDTLEWDNTDSTEVHRRLREGAYEE